MINHDPDDCDICRGLPEDDPERLPRMGHDPSDCEHCAAGESVGEHDDAKHPPDEATS